MCTPTAGTQHALWVRGYRLGPAGADSVTEPRTIAAVGAVERAAGLVNTGIAGPLTRKAFGSIDVMERSYRAFRVVEASTQLKPPHRGIAHTRKTMSPRLNKTISKTAQPTKHQAGSIPQCDMFALRLISLRNC
ncbi:peptidoglycan-binding domain-containing protein [Methylobacterium sp. Leaf87]|uniref:peptidoglycan-binding domain-containing protein n=1 Tax=Methylobacterium sp. Leaf87 TaxID=1736243 RepID=UPI0032972081